MTKKTTPRDAAAVNADIDQLRARRAMLTDRIATLETRISEDRETRARAVADDTATDAGNDSASSIAAMKEDITTIQRSIELLDGEIDTLKTEAHRVTADETEIADKTATNAAEQARGTLEAALREFATATVIPLDIALRNALSMADGAHYDALAAKSQRDGTPRSNNERAPSELIMLRRTELKSAIDALKKIVGDSSPRWLTSAPSSEPAAESTKSLSLR